MEPFELALSQVNFEEEDLRKGGHDDLSAFSNTFSYESDFKDVDVATSGVPLLAKRVKDNPSKFLNGCCTYMIIFQKCSFRANMLYVCFIDWVY